MTLQVQRNARAIVESAPIPVGAVSISITPPMDENYWLLRVPVSDTQAIVLFPKFGLFGIGFQKEEDWNTNLPSKASAEEIFAHIRHNKGDESIPDELCIMAIRLLQEEIERLTA